jgi:hypothetical protein
MERSAVGAQGWYRCHTWPAHALNHTSSKLIPCICGVVELLGEARIGLRSLFVTNADGGEKWLTLKKYS